jgi:hypothetical protein
MMRALSIRQPWAWLIVNGHKDIENRVWSTRYVGPLVIHAAKGMTNDEYDDVVDMLSDDPRLRHIQLPDRKLIDRGGIVGIAHCNGSVDQCDSPWFFGPYGFVLSNQRAFHTMIPFKGQLGFFDVPASLIQTANNIGAEQGQTKGSANTLNGGE